MKIIIEGTAKEIADLAEKAQGQQDRNLKFSLCQSTQQLSDQEIRELCRSSFENLLHEQQ